MSDDIMIDEATAKQILKYTDGIKLDTDITTPYDDTTGTVSLSAVNDFYTDTIGYVESIMYKQLTELLEKDRQAVEVAIYKLTAVKFIDKVTNEAGTRLDWSKELEAEALKVINNFKSEGLYAL